MEHAAAHREGGGGPKGKLYVVATPIGNLADVTLRALEVLKAADVIAAEDTRVAAKLLHHYAISKRLVAVHEHNERGAARRINALLAAGQSVALVTDAGTPGISDPGALVVVAARAAGFTVIPIPGASAVACALSAAGVAVPQFLFYGFLPQQAGTRRRALESLKSFPYPMVFFEAPHRVVECVRDMTAAFGAERRVTLARELTKLFETIESFTLEEAARWLAADDNRRRGEFVLVVTGAGRKPASGGEHAERVLQILLEQVPVKQAAALAAKICGARKNEMYRLALQLAGKR